LNPEQLAAPVDPEILERARRRASISPEKLWASIQTLEDAYQAAHQIEAEEFDAILEPIMLDFFPNDIRNALARSQLQRHLNPLERLRTKEWRLTIHRR